MEEGAMSWGDYELPSVSSTFLRKARKDHVCCECRRTIEILATYEVHNACMDGSWSVFKTCGECLELRAKFQESGDGSYPIGDLVLACEEVDLIERGSYPPKASP